MNDELLFAAEDESQRVTANPNAPPWLILIVDDDPDIHSMTRMLLRDLRFNGRGAHLLSAMSAAEGERILRSHPDIALVLLDVVMESDDAGLRLVRLIREQLHNRRISIVLRTGQPGNAPEQDVILRYDINDYKEKTELTVKKLFTTVIAGLRHYEAITDLERNRAGLERLLAGTSTLFDARSITEFANRAAAEVNQLVGGDAQVSFLPGLQADGISIRCRIHEPLTLLVARAEPLDAIERRLVEVCCARLAVGFDNVRLQEDMLGSMSEGFAVFDRDGSLTLWNARALVVLRLAPSEIRRGMSYGDIAERVVAAGGQVRMGATEHDEITWPDGRVVQIRRGATDEGGRVHVYVDVTEERRRQREMQQARAEAEAAAAARAEFLAVMSHEIRTPLNGILGMTRLALDTDDPASVRECLETVRYSGEALRTIVDDVLDFSKLDAGRMTFEAVVFDMRRTVAGVLSLMSSRASEKGLHLSEDITSDVPVMLRGDASRLRQVLLNLVGNAIKFTERGSVTVSVRRERRRVAAGRARLRISVDDTGIGIDSAARDRLFQAYSQGDSSVARRFGGTGLGLAICKRIVEQQGGAIGVESVVGKGSQFWFLLDFAIEEGFGAEPTASQAITQSATPLRILLAEDNEINRRVAVGLLQRQGHAVVAVPTGRAALDRLNEDAGFDVVLMDLNMPEMDGLEAVKRLRARGGAAAHLPVIALTASATDGERDSALAAGMDAFVSKPLDPDQLARVLVGLTQAQHGEPDHAPDVFEARALEILRDHLGEDMVAELVASFFDSADRTLHDLEQALDHDLRAAAFLAHRFSGSAASIGLVGIAKLCGRIERACNNGDPSPALAEAATLPALVAQARRQLKEFG